MKNAAASRCIKTLMAQRDKRHKFSSLLHQVSVHHLLQTLELQTYLDLYSKWGKKWIKVCCTLRWMQRMSVIFHFYLIFWPAVADASGFQSLGCLQLQQKLQREENHDWEELCIFWWIRSRVVFWAFTADRKACSSVMEWTFSLNAWNKQLFGWFGANVIQWNIGCRWESTASQQRQGNTRL